MDKYTTTNKNSKKKYNADKTYVQISKSLHSDLKDYCQVNNIKIKEFLEEIIRKRIHS